MVDIATYKTAIKTWVEAQGGGITAQWRDEQGGWQSKTRARLHLKNPVGVGVEHTTWDHDTELPDGSDYVPTISGDRRITLSIRVTSRDQSGSNVAIWHLDKLRASLKKKSVKDLLYAAGLATSTIETPVDVEHIVDDRRESVSIMDVHFNAVYNERDEDEGESFVQTFGVAGELTDPTGSDVGWSETEMP